MSAAPTQRNMTLLATVCAIVAAAPATAASDPFNLLNWRGTVAPNGVAQVQVVSPLAYVDDNYTASRVSGGFTIRSAAGGIVTGGVQRTIDLAPFVGLGDFVTVRYTVRVRGSTTVPTGGSGAVSILNWSSIVSSLGSDTENGWQAFSLVSGSPLEIKDRQKQKLVNGVVVQSDPNIFGSYAVVASFALGTTSFLDLDSQLRCQTVGAGFCQATMTFVPNRNFITVGSAPASGLLPSFSVTPLSAVPEPSTWAMLLVGFGTSAAMMRRSRRRAAIG